jgi:undecaprenyl-diphosphatase
MDRSILLSLRDKDDLADPIGPRWVEESMRDFTALGGVAVLTLLSGAAIGFLLIERKSAAALLLFAAVFGGWVAATLLKMGFDRARPDLVPHGSHVYTASFPSGHAMMAAVTYLTIGALLARLHQGLWTKAYFLILAALLTIAVGISRVYLGVHWPTDVLAGWTIGGCWALLCWTAAKLLQQRGQVEQAKPAPEGEPSEVDAAA